MAWLALLKAVSLGYTLGAVALSLAAALWWLLERYVAPHLRARTGFWVFAGTFALNTLFTTLLYVGVTTGQIRMTTGMFHYLMGGGWAAAITGSGILLLIASLAISVAGLRRGLSHHRRDTVPVPGSADTPGVPLRFSRHVATLALVGGWRPQIWINPGYWQLLDNAQQQLALRHELQHFRHHDNSKQLVLDSIGALYAILPWLRRWTAHYRFLSEVAVDSACLRTGPAAGYRELVAAAAGWQVAQAVPLASNLNASQLAQRLAYLDRAPVAGGWFAAITSLVAVLLLGSLPSVALAALAETRCLVACYLGY